MLRKAPCGFNAFRQPPAQWLCGSNASWQPTDQNTFVKPTAPKHLVEEFGNTPERQKLLRATWTLPADIQLEAGSTATPVPLQTRSRQTSRPQSDASRLHDVVCTASSYLFSATSFILPICAVNDSQSSILCPLSWQMEPSSAQRPQRIRPKCFNVICMQVDS